LFYKIFFYRTFIESLRDVYSSRNGLSSTSLFVSLNKHPQSLSCENSQKNKFSRLP